MSNSRLRFRKLIVSRSGTPYLTDKPEMSGTGYLTYLLTDKPEMSGTGYLTYLLTDKLIQKSLCLSVFVVWLFPPGCLYPP